MADLLVLDLVDKQLVTDQIVLTVGYDMESLSNTEKMNAYCGKIVTDPYGRKIPKHAHGSLNLGTYTSSTKEILDGVTALYDQIIDTKLLIRRLNLAANHVLDEDTIHDQVSEEQLNLFTDYDQEKRLCAEREAMLEREKQQQRTILYIKKRFGKNAILKGMNLEEGATTKDRNRQIGGHKA